MRDSHWRKYFSNMQCTLAMTRNKDVAIDYGEIVYTSPEVNNTRWIVSKYQDEYNVFVDDSANNTKPERKWGACFLWKDRAVSFALKMALICSGKIHRRERHSL